MRWMNSRTAGYNWLNAIGSVILAYIAFHPVQIGFIVLEGTWVLVSVFALARPRRQE